MAHKIIVKKRIVQCGEIIDPSSKVGPLPPLPNYRPPYNRIATFLQWTNSKAALSYQRTYVTNFNLIKINVGEQQGIEETMLIKNKIKLE